MWFYFALITTVLSTISTLYTKNVLKNVNSSVVTLSLVSLNIPLLLFLLLESDSVKMDLLFFVGIFGSAILYALAKILGLSAMRRSELSQVIPLSSIGILITYLFSVIFLDETVGTFATAGLIIMSLGIYVLNADQLSSGMLTPFKVLVTKRDPRIYITSTILGSIIPIFDKLSLNHMTPANPTLLLLCQNLAIIPFVFGIITHRHINWIPQLTKNLTPLLLNSILYGSYVIIAFYGFTAGPIALTIGIMNSRTLLILLFSYLFLGDKPTKFTIFGSLLTFLGVILLKTG